VYRYGKSKNKRHKKDCRKACKRE